MKFEDWIQTKPPIDAQFEKNWRSKYCEWAEYIVEMDINDSQAVRGEPHLELNDWIRKNSIGRSSVYLYEVYFELEEDSVMFALRWV